MAPWAALAALSLTQARAQATTRQQLATTRADLHALRTWGEAHIRCYHLTHHPDTHTVAVGDGDGDGETTLRRVV